MAAETEKKAAEPKATAPKQTTPQTASLNIFQRMLAATSEINRVAKNLKVDISKSQSYKAVAESDVLEAVKPIEEKYASRSRIC